MCGRAHPREPRVVRNERQRMGRAALFVFLCKAHSKTKSASLENNDFGGGIVRRARH